jgi:hypothetical protein
MVARGKRPQVVPPLDRREKEFCALKGRKKGIRTASAPGIRNGRDGNTQSFFRRLKAGVGLKGTLIPAPTCRDGLLSNVRYADEIDRPACRSLQ